MLVEVMYGGAVSVERISVEFDEIVPFAYTIFFASVRVMSELLR